jgi:hypothetical protein
MMNPHLRFSDDMQVVRAQQVVILVYRARERILDRHDAAMRNAAGDGTKQFLERRAGDELQRGAMGIEGGRVGE